MGTGQPGASVGQVLQVTGQAAEISAFVQPYPIDFTLGIVSPQVVMKLAYMSGMPAALAAAFSWSVVASVQAACRSCRA
jgi:hypothetical protein